MCYIQKVYDFNDLLFAHTYFTCVVYGFNLRFVTLNTHGLLKNHMTCASKPAAQF